MPARRRNKTNSKFFLEIPDPSKKNILKGKKLKDKEKYNLDYFNHKSKRGFH